MLTDSRELLKARGHAGSAHLKSDLSFRLSSDSSEQHRTPIDVAKLCSHAAAPRSSRLMAGEQLSSWFSGALEKSLEAYGKARNVL